MLQTQVQFVFPVYIQNLKVGWASRLGFYRSHRGSQWVVSTTRCFSYFSRSYCFRWQVNSCLENRQTAHQHVIIGLFYLILLQVLLRVLGQLFLEERATPVEAPSQVSWLLHPLPLLSPNSNVTPVCQMTSLKKNQCMGLKAGGEHIKVPFIFFRILLFCTWNYLASLSEHLYSCWPWMYSAIDLVLSSMWVPVASGREGAQVGLFFP